MFSNTTPASARSNIFGQTTPIAQGPVTLNPNAMMTLQAQDMQQQQQQMLPYQQQQFQQWQLQQQQQQPYQQQQLQQQQQQITGQDQQNQPGQQQYSNQAQYGQQYIPQYQEPQNYTNPNAIPDKINLEFYGIVDRIYYIKAYLVLRFRNWQIIYHCNQANRSVSESEARVIVKNFLDFQQLEYDCVYQITTEEGFWILKITDLDRVYLVFYDKNYRKDLAFSLFEEYYKTITQQDFLNVSDHIELFTQITQKLNELTEAYEQKLLENKDPASAIEYQKAEFQQNCFQIGLNQQCFITCVEKLKLKTVVNQIHPAFQGSNLINDFKANFQPILSICICFLLVIIVLLLLYNFVIKDIIEIHSESTQGQNKHLHLPNQ